MGWFIRSKEEQIEHERKQIVKKSMQQAEKEKRQKYKDEEKEAYETEYQKARVYAAKRDARKAGMQRSSGGGLFNALGTLASNAGSNFTTPSKERKNDNGGFPSMDFGGISMPTMDVFGGKPRIYENRKNKKHVYKRKTQKKGKTKTITIRVN
jgi:hypothetical protein